MVDRVFVQPAAHDGGLALGAALYPFLNGDSAAAPSRSLLVRRAETPDLRYSRLDFHTPGAARMTSISPNFSRKVTRANPSENELRLQPHLSTSYLKGIATPFDLNVT